MSSSPDPTNQEFADFPAIPRGGNLWPLALLAFLLGAFGLYLMLPVPPVPEPVLPPVSSPQAPNASRGPRAGIAQLAIVGSANSTFGQTATLFSEQVKALTRGALQIEVLPEGRVNGQNYGELDLMRMVQEGRLPLAFISISPLTNAAPELAVLDLPFLFDSYQHVDRVVDGPLGRELLETLKPSGLVGLAYVETGFRILSSSMPLPDLASLKGRRIRVMQSPVYVNFVKALGAEPVPSAVDRIHEMGRQGFIDAADRSYPTYWDFKLYEVHRHITETNHAYSSKVLVANREWWDRLPPQSRLALEQAARQAEVEHRARQRQEEARVRSRAAREKIAIYTLSPEERERFRARVQPLYESFTRQHGSGLVRRIRQQAGPGSTQPQGLEAVPGQTPDLPSPNGGPQPGNSASPTP